MKVNISRKIDKSWYLKPKRKVFRIRKGAGGVIVRKESTALLLCLVKDDSWSEYILPKGGKDDGETYLQTAKREIEEETGLYDLRLVAKLGVKQRLSFDKTYWSKMHYFLFLTDQIEGVPTDPLENYKPQWFDLNNLPPMFWPEQKELIEENKQMIVKMLHNCR